MFDPEDYSIGVEEGLVYINQVDDQTEQTRSIILTRATAEALVKQLIEQLGLFQQN